ncbi:MAG TPA: aminoacyl-tRNA hydrolase [Alphaproteobacteria bacterium]|nr:aminoacyl-tRNA hydrolase [Alphaproteobacteria bacterium]
MWIFVGLGNPGKEYAGNRHNVGFMAVDQIVRRQNLPPYRKRFNAYVSEGVIGGEKVLIVRPQTYMNNSGQAVSEAARFYKIPAEQVVVFYDELDLEPSKVRVKVGGGSAGHNGIRSIDAHIGNGFKRVRIGIGHPGHKELVHRYVLHDFAKADLEWLEPLLDAIADASGDLVRGDDGDFMNKVALKVRPQRPNGAKKSDKGTDT